MKCPVYSAKEPGFKRSCIFLAGDFCDFSQHHSVIWLRLSSGARRLNCINEHHLYYAPAFCLKKFNGIAGVTSMGSVKMAHVSVWLAGMAVIVQWRAAQTAAVGMVSVESTAMVHGNVAVMMAGMEETAVLLWNRVVVMEGTMTKVSSCFTLCSITVFTD